VFQLDDFDRVLFVFVSYLVALNIWKDSNTWCRIFPQKIVFFKWMNPTQKIVHVRPVK
jgi:hypothetical protein